MKRRLKIQQVLNGLCLTINIYMRGDTFSTEIHFHDSGIVNLHPTKGTHWVMFINEYYFDSYGKAPPNNMLKHRQRFIIK